MNITKELQNRIIDAPDGTIFINSDFRDLASSETIRRLLNRFVKSGLLRRVINGIYEKPEYSSLLHEMVATNPDSVAYAVARSFHWTIAPCENTALNLLGLSTQVPNVWSYVSDGPYRTYHWMNTTLEFKHRENRDITGMSSTTLLVIQALKGLGKQNITDDTINSISKRLTIDEKRICLFESKESTDWIFETIKRICSGGNNENDRKIIR